MVFVEGLAVFCGDAGGERWLQDICSYAVVISVCGNACTVWRPLVRLVSVLRGNEGKM